MAQKSNNNSKSHAPVKVTEAEGKEKALKPLWSKLRKTSARARLCASEKTWQ